MESPLEFVKDMGWTWRYSDNMQSIQIETCPFCHAKDWTFGINPYTGQWRCFHMNRHAAGNFKTEGNLVTLRRHLGLTLDVVGKDEKIHALDFIQHRFIETAHKNLLTDPVAINTLCDEWGIDLSVIRKWKLGISEDAAHANRVEWLVIPHIINGELYNYKLRSWFGYPKQFQRHKGASSVLLNEELLSAEETPQYVVLCEGEKDAIIAEHCGLKNVVGVTCGAGSFSERCYALIENIERIYLAYDGDDAGNAGMQKLIKRLGHQRIRIMNLPQGKDIADCAKEFGKEYVLELFRNAQPPKIGNVASAAEALYSAITKEHEPVFDLPWECVNRRLGGGVGLHHVVTVSAPPKIGKTSMTLVWALYWALQKDMPVLFWCVEMGMETLAKYAVSILSGTTRKPSRTAMAWVYRTLKETPIYFGCKGDVTQEQIFETFKDCHDRYGISAVFFDNVHYMVRGFTDWSTKSLAIENFMKGCKLFATEYNVPVIAVAQPTKGDMKKGKDLDYTGIAGSGSFASDSDTIIILHRDKLANDETSYASEMMVKIDAAREAAGGVAYLRLSKSSLSYHEMSREEVNQLVAKEEKASAKKNKSESLFASNLG